MNELPIKTVNGSTVYIRDVAYAHDGSPPQRNVVRVNGHRAVLMTVLKSGAASTLDIVEHVKALLPKLEETLPRGAACRAVGGSVAVCESGDFRRGARKA